MRVESLTALFVVCGLFASSEGLAIPLGQDEGQDLNGAPNGESANGPRCGEDIGPTVVPQYISPDTEKLNDTVFYRQNLDCYWNINADEGHVILLKSEDFAVELSENCVWDYLEVRDGEDDPRTVRFCGWENFEYLSTSNYLKIGFVTDDSFEDSGFKVQVTQVEADSEKSLICLSHEVEGSHVSVYNRENIAQDCYYRIDAPDGQHVQVTVHMVQFGATPCNEEVLTVYNGPTSQSVKTDVCSDFVVPHEPIDIASSSVLVHYKNPEVEGERFELRYSFIPPIPTTTAPTTTPSPVGGHGDCSKLFQFSESEYLYATPEYEDNKECVVVVKNTQKQDYVVQIEFTDFDMESSTNCVFDSLRVLAGERTDSPELGGPYCGQKLKSRTLVTNGNALRLEYKTDESLALLGFNAKITFVERETCTCPRNKVCVMENYEKRCFSKTCSGYCENGGTCVVTKDSKSCYCPRGFAGETCDKEVEDVGKQYFGFDIAPKSEFHKKDESLFIQCGADTPDDVDYQWMFNEQLVGQHTGSSGFGWISGARAGSVLQIDEFGEHYEGVYVCMATTKYGKAEQSFTLHLEIPCSKDKLESMTGPASTEENLGSTVKLACSTVPQVDNIKWKKDGRYIDFEQETRFTQLITGHLVIKDLELDDSGKYTCEAVSDDHCSSERSGELTVLHVRAHGQYCGMSVHDEAHLSGYVVLGKEAHPKEHPWYVRLGNVKGKHTGTFCGGSLISRKYVLTAAHCIDDLQKIRGVEFNEDTVRLYLGTNDCKGINATVRKPAKVHSHEEYTHGEGWDNDIALLEMDSPIEYPEDRSILPICIEPEEFNERKFLGGKKSIGVSFGQAMGCGTKGKNRATSTSVLMANLPYVKKEMCEEEFEALTDNMFCAGEGIKRLADVCHGDSGGPLIMPDGNRWVQTGIVSHGKGCSQDAPSVFTNVGKYYEWIRKITNFDDENTLVE